MSQTISLNYGASLYRRNPLELEQALRDAGVRPIAVSNGLELYDRVALDRVARAMTERETGSKVPSAVAPSFIPWVRGVHSSFRVDQPKR